MTNYLELPPGRDLPYTLNAVIEIPRGSINKYEYDKSMNIFRLDRTLFSPVHYPGDYGFVPQTHAEDGDPLDVIVIMDQPTFVGCVMEVRPLGVLIMRDDMGLDHKILCVPVSDPRMRDVHGLQHLSSHQLKEIDYFFNIYKDLEGKKSDTYGWEDRVVAYQVVEQCIQRYKDLKAGRVPQIKDTLAVDAEGALIPKGRPVSATQAVRRILGEDIEVETEAAPRRAPAKTAIEAKARAKAKAKAKAEAKSAKASSKSVKAASKVVKAASQGKTKGVHATPDPSSKASLPSPRQRRPS